METAGVMTHFAIATAIRQPHWRHSSVTTSSTSRDCIQLKLTLCDCIMSLTWRKGVKKMGSCNFLLYNTLLRTKLDEKCCTFSKKSENFSSIKNADEIKEKKKKYLKTRPDFVLMTLVSSCSKRIKIVRPVSHCKRVCVQCGAIDAIIAVRRFIR